VEHKLSVVVRILHRWVDIQIKVIEKEAVNEGNHFENQLMWKAAA